MSNEQLDCTCRALETGATTSGVDSSEGDRSVGVPDEPKRNVQDVCESVVDVAPTLGLRAAAGQGSSSSSRKKGGFRVYHSLYVVSHEEAPRYESVPSKVL